MTRNFASDTFGSRGLTKACLGVQQEGAMLLERVGDNGTCRVECLPRIVDQAYLTFPTMERSGGEQAAPSPDLLLQNGSSAEDFPVPTARPIAMPTQRFEFWTPSLILSAMAGAVRRWIQAAPLEPQTASSSDNHA
jgi:hypothetical protein